MVLRAGPGHRDLGHRGAGLLALRRAASPGRVPCPRHLPSDDIGRVAPVVRREPARLVSAVAGHRVADLPRRGLRHSRPNRPADDGGPHRQKLRRLALHHPLGFPAVSLVSTIWLVVLLARKGDPHDNRFGPAPQGDDAEANAWRSDGKGRAGQPRLNCVARNRLTADILHPIWGPT